MNAVLSQSPRFRVHGAMPHPELGMILFILTELMFFVALISSYLIIKSKVGDWVPPASVVLPVRVTALNTFFLLVSGASLFWAGIRFQSRKKASLRPYLIAIILGITFVGIQGMEWINLISYGMTMTSGIFGACFFLLIGAHGLHAIGGVSVLVWFLPKVASGQISCSGFRAIQYFWFFIVGVWPALYGLVYF